MRAFRPRFTRSITSLQYGQAWPSPKSRHYRPAWRQRRSVSDNRTVRIRRPWWTWRGTLLYALYGTLGYSVLRYGLGMVIEVETVESDRHQEQGDATFHVHRRDNDTGGKDDDGDHRDGKRHIVSIEDEEADQAFLPLAWPKKLPQRFYRNSDPDWQEFAKLSRDPERQKKIKHELAEHLAKSMTGMANAQLRLGDNMKWSKLWLDFVFPDGPPPEYSRKGLLVLEDEIAWAEQRIPHSYYIQLRHTLWPLATYKALRGSLEALYVLQSIRLKNLFSLELSEREKSVLAKRQIISMHRRAQAEASEASSATPTIPQEDQTPSAAPEAEATLAEGLRAAQQIDRAPTSAQDPSDKEKEGFVLPIFGVKPPQVSVPVDLFISSGYFLNALSKNFTKDRMDSHPLGCCFVIGEVEVVGSRGKVKMGVKAAYNPKADKVIWMQSRPLAFFELKQRAKGGP